MSADISSSIDSLQSSVYLKETVFGIDLVSISNAGESFSHFFQVSVIEFMKEWQSSYVTEFMIQKLFSVRLITEFIS